MLYEVITYGQIPYILSRHILKIPFRRYFRVFRPMHIIKYHKTCAVIHITYLRTELHLPCSNGT